MRKVIMMKRIVVAGGRGLIGQAFIQRTLAAGFEVLVLTRKQVINTADPALKTAVWDGRTVGEWQQWLEGAQAVVNLTGENLGAGLWTAKRKKRILDSRLDAGRALVQALEITQVKPKVFLQASAIGYYGATDGQAVTESSPAVKDFLAKICLDWEASTLAVEKMGLRRALLRTGIVMARNGVALPRMLPLFKMYAGGPLGSGRQYWSWISLEDEAEAMWFLLNKEDASGAYNLTAPHPVTMAEFGRTLAAVLKRPYWLPVPSFALRMVLGEMSSLLLYSQRILPERLLKAGFQFEHADLRSALMVLRL
jgi:uncharacterized protein (TIGR01777 family)